MNKDYTTEYWLYHYYWDKEKSTTEIAKMWGISQSTIWRLMERFNIARRGHGIANIGKRQTEETKKKIRTTLQEYYKNNPDAQRGENHSCWEGGKTTYYQTQARKTGEKHYDYPIPKGFVIHHRDRDVTNNIMGNLVLLTYSLHAKVHGFGRRDAYSGERQEE